MDNVVLTDLGEVDSVNKGVLVEMSLGGDDRWHGKNAETEFSDAITMQAEARWRAEERKRKQKELEGIEAVALADAGDEDARRRLSLYHEHWGWTQLDVALHDREHRDEVLGDGLARVYGTGDPGAVWDAMNASADYEYEQMPVWNTRAEGMRLVWGRFAKMVQGKKAAADAAQAAVNERRKGLEAFVDGKEAKRDEGGKLADDAITDGRLWELVNQGVLEVSDVQRAQKVREFMRRYVVPLGKRAEMDERMRGLDGLRDEVYELIGEDKDTARLIYESLMRWAGEQRGKNDTGAGDEFQVAVGKKLSDWARAVDVVAPLALLSVGAPGPVAPALVEQAVGTYEARRDKNERQRFSSGILRAGIDEAMKVQEGGWWQSVKNAPRVAAAMAGDTLPYLVPFVGAGLGTADAFVRGFTSGIDAKVLDAEFGGNKGGWESRKAMGNAAMVESGIQALAELLPWGRVGRKGFAASVGRKMKAVTGGKYVPGALSRALARGTQKSVTRALVAEFGANVVTEGVLEPIAQGALTLTAEGLMDLAGVEHGRSKSFSEAFAELGEIWEPEQLAGFLMFSAALTAPAYGQARKNVQLYQANVKKFAKNAEVWETQGLSRAEAEEAAGADDPLERGNQLVAEGWKNDPAGMSARLVQKHKELKDSGRTLVFAGVQGKSGFDADTVKLLGEAWRASKDKYHLPDVELLGDGRVQLTRAEVPGVVEGIDLTLTEEQADAFLFQELNRIDMERMRDWQKSGGNVEEYEGLQTKLAGLVDVAMGDVAVDAAVAEGSMDVEEMGKGLPEELRGLIKEAGGMNLGVAKKISEWAIGQMETLEAGGMSRAEAREQVASEKGGATLEVLAGMGASMQKRLEAAGDMSLRSALNRRRGGRRVQFNGRSVLGNVLVHARGGATGMNAVEDISESVFDMMVQGRTEAILENQAAARKAAGEAVRPATLTEVRAAEEQAWKELAEVASKAREALLKVDPDLAIEEVNGDSLNTIEALSTMAMSRYLGSGVLPRWMSGLVDVMRKNVQAAAAVVQLQKAMVALGEQDAGALKDLLEFLDDAGVQVGKSLAGARVEAVADRIRELARWNAGADAAGPGGVGGMSVSQAQEEVLEEEDEIQQNDRAREAVAAAKPADAAKREDEADREMFERDTNKGIVPGRMKGVFVGDAAVYSAAGDFWSGLVEKNKLSDGTEQVKVGEKGKHGVIAGKELTGRFVNDTDPIRVWKRKNGELWVISGRHRFAKRMEDETGNNIMCYVYEESDERDERWARMKDYEQNMRDDQADEVTCAVYARETGKTEMEMFDEGLTRKGSRSKRGIFIGQHAREELWTRFRNGEIKPMDAELVCKLTAALADQSQVAEIQAHCCGLLKAGKSWDYIGASVQLMASSQAQQAEQMLLDLGADFTANLEKMARWVELCRKAFREAIDLLKDEKRRVKKGAKASRLGLSATMTEEKREEMLGDLEAMDAKFEMIGSYPELVAEAKMWDGDESKFADPVAMYLERVEAMQAEGLQEEQTRKAAEEATGMFNWSSSLTPSRARAAWNGRVAGKEVQRVVDFNGVPVDLAVSSHLGEKGGDALRRVVAGDYRERLDRWKQQSLAVLQGMVSKKKWNDVEQHVRAGKATMDVVKRAIAEGKIAPLPKQGVKVSDEELRTLHHKRIVYFEKRKGEVLDLLEGVMGVRSVDESKLSSSVYFNTPYGKVRLSDHAEPMGTGHVVSTVLDLRYDMSDAEVLAAAELYTAEVGGRGARIAKAFHQVEAQESVAVDVPGVYVESVSEAKNAIKDAYDELKKNPVTMSDGSEVRFYAPGLNEVKQHAGDRRVFAAIAKMRELSEKAVYIDTALNTQKDIPSKKTIERYHYYLSKGNFLGYKEWENSRGRNAGVSGDAYVMIVVAEEENGDKFYDLDATDVEDVEANKGASAALEATRFPKAGRQGHDAPKGRIHRVKEYVNHIDAQNGNFSASLTGGKNLAAVSPEMDARYMAAVERGDMDTAQRMVNEVARKRGYLPGSDYQGTEAFNGVAPSSNAYFDTADERYEAWQNGDFEGDISLADFVRRGMDPGELEWLVSSPGEYQRANKYRRESIEAIRKAKASKQGKVTIYRAVQADVKEKSVRNGDWVTLSKAYAEYHISLQDWEKGRIIKQEVSIDDVWWDGNDVNEWGYDDGKEYAYRNTANNRKLLAPVTYDENGDIVPLSKRFNYRSADVSFSVIGRNAKTWGKYTDRAFVGRDDGMWRAEIDASQAKLKKASMHQTDDSLVREMEKRLAFFREKVEERGRWESVSKLWAAGEYGGSTYGEMDFLMRTLRGAGVEFESLHQMVERGVFSIVLESDAAAAAKRLLLMVEIPGVEGFNRLGEVLDFPELYEAYPELKKVPVRWMDDNFSFRGIFSTEGVFKEAFIAVKRSRTDGGKLSTLLHEVQHWIQKHEGFAFGSPGGVKEHRVSAGEIEARNVQARRWMTADERAELPFNETLEYPGEALVTYSLTGAAAAGRRVLEESGDEYVANRLQEAWQKNLEKWSVLHAGKADANSAMRAVMEMEGLVKATYDVVQDDVKLGRLYMLQRWAMVYARMVESGEIPPKGALKGQAYEKFVERLVEQQRTERRRGMSREQAEELVKELGVTRLEGAMEKVARECMRAAEWHLKQKETARVKRLLEAAWPKREEGKKSPRGKLAAREYRRLEWIAKVMELSAEDKYNETQRIIREIDELPQELVGYEERVAELEGKLAALDPKQADYVERKAELDKAMRELNPNEVGYDEAKAELEDQLNWLHVFGGWADMDVSQARKAARALEDLLLRGYTEWERKVQRERERTRRVADEISAHFKAPWYATRMERKADADAMGTNKPKMVKGLRWGLMGYAQMMLALRKKLGKVFCDRQRRTLAEAHRNLLQAQKDLQDWSAMELQKITGLTGAALEQWIASNNQNVNTGIMMQQVRGERIRMNAKEVDKLGAMSEKEYEAWRDGELAKAEADGRAVVLPTAEELLVLRGLRLEKPRRKWLEVERTEQQAVELVATKEAMLYAVLLFEQPDYEHLVEAHGLSGADVLTMKKLIGPKLLRWGYAMRRHLNENGELLAAKYEAWNGTPFGRRANYFRGVFDVNMLKPETDIIDGNAGANSLGGSKYSILIPRRYHRQQINWQVGASQVFMLTMNEQNNYIHTQHITREWRQLLSRKGFADGLSAEIGANAVNMIKLHLDVIDAAPRADAAMTSLFGRLVQGVMKATAISSLALNVYSYMKQVSCLLNAIVGGYVPDAAVKQSGVYQVLTYSGIGAGELVRSYARVLSGRGAVSFKEMTGSAVIQSRIQSGGKRVADALMMRTGQAMPNAVGRAGEVSGEWALEQMDMIDRKANTVSAMVVADAVYRKLAATEGGKEAGDKWVRAQAIEAAGLMVDLVAQPKLRTQKGLWASHGGFFGGVGNFFYMFRSESLAKIGTYLAQVSSGDYAKALGGFMSMGVGLWLVGLLCSFLKGQIDGDDLDDEEDLLKFARKSVTEVIFGDLASLPIVGGGIGAAKAAVGGTWHYVQDPLQMILPVSDLWKRPKQLYKAVDNEGIWSFKAMRALCNCLRAGGNASGWGMGTGSAVTSSAAGIILGAAVLGNAGRFVLDVAERVTED